MTHREPQDWNDFRSIVANAAKSAGYDDMHAFISMLDDADPMTAPLHRMWEEINFDPAAHMGNDEDLDGPVGFWEYWEDSLYNMLADLAKEYSDPWNREPGDAADKLDPAQFAQRVTSEIVGRPTFAGPDPMGEGRRARTDNMSLIRESWDKFFGDGE